jgi:hypothetical protein
LLKVEDLNVNSVVKIRWITLAVAVAVSVLMALFSFSGVFDCSKVLSSGIAEKSSRLDFSDQTSESPVTISDSESVAQAEKLAPTLGDPIVRIDRPFPPEEQKQVQLYE